MDHSINIISKIEIEKFVDDLIAKGLEDLGNRRTSISSYELNYEQISKNLKLKLHGFPCDISLEFTGSPERWNIKILDCIWWRRPVLWWKLRQYKGKLGKGPMWDLSRGVWVDRQGKPLSEKRIRELGLDDDPTADFL